MLIAATAVTMAQAGDRQRLEPDRDQDAAELERQRQRAVADFLRRSQLRAIAPLPGASAQGVNERRRASTDR